MAAAGDDGGDGSKNPAAVDGGDDGKNPAAFWIDAARYTVALVVTVLIISVIVNAIKFVTRTDPLHFSVVGGFVSTVQLPPNKVALDLNVRAQNPSGRARMYYVNITAYLFDNNTSASTSLNPGFDSIAVLPNIPDIVVTQQTSVDSSVHAKVTNRSMPDYFDVLYNGGRISGVTLRLDGNLTTEVLSGVNKTRLTNYYCDNLLLGGDKDDEAFKGRPDVICSHDHPSSMTVHIEPMMIQASWPFVFAIFLALF